MKNVVDMAAEERALDCVVSPILYEMDEVVFSLDEEEPLSFFQPEHIAALSLLEVGEEITVHEGVADFDVRRVS